MRTTIVCLVCALLLPGCAVSVGSGTTYGYIEAVGEEFGATTVYVKSSLESSKSDLYCADDSIRDDLEYFAATGERVKITYKSDVCFGPGLVGGSSDIEGKIVAVEAVNLTR